VKAEAEKQPQIERKEHKWISWEDLEKVLEEIPSPLRDRVIEDLQDDIKTGLTAEDQIDAGTLLEEVARRVFGFSLRDLSSAERREIENIKNDLEMLREAESTS
jgi:hypothetical protein